ncbi:MAG TPA: helix-hairpin-helix domain-containing protein [Gemmatimonadaceae bacterium]|nr:helix-hairpin-helix domain-containing protein [Gemmatimonadaceae bacterium]
MITQSERKALLFLAAVVALGAGARVVRARTADSPAEASRAALSAQLARVDSVRKVRRGKHGRVRAKPAEVQPGDPPIDLDQATPAEIERLPGIGKVVAERIVFNRDSFGTFGSLKDLQRVKGVGPKLAERIRPHVTFSGIARPLNAVISPGRALQ